IVMANPNPDNLNVPNEGVLEEDPHRLLDYDEEEDSETEIEEEEPEEDPVEEPKPLAGHGDQFDAHHNPQPGNMNAEEADDEPEAEEADNELEVEEAGVEPEAEGADVEPFAVCDFPMGFSETGESSTARDPQFVETSRTEVALLGSEAKIRKMEREILHHDLSSVEEALGKVV
nr:hypothetical protein [Tanacetum cinerariifolium]